MKKEKIKNIVLIIVVAVISSTITSFAENNFLFNSVDVKYDNSNGVQAETVQGAIDELYSCASDYSSVNNKIDGYFKNNPTSYFDGNTLMLGKTNTVGNTALQFFNDGIMNGHIYTRKSDQAMVVTSDNNNPLILSGRPINLASDQVQIDGVDVVTTSNTVNAFYNSRVKLSNGGYGDINFSQDISNFKYIIIYYRYQAHSSLSIGIYSSVYQVPDIENTNITLSAAAYGLINNSFIQYTGWATYQMDFTNNKLKLLSFARSDGYTTANQLFITAIVGFK